MTSPGFQHVAQGRGSYEACGPRADVPMRLPIVIAIPGAEMEQNVLRQTHAHYIVESVAFGMPAKAKRTFEDFEGLYASLSRKVRQPLQPLPPADWTSFWSESPQLVEERRVQLELVLQRSLLIPEVLTDGEESLLRFLDLPAAARIAVRFLSAVPRSRGIWLNSLYETTEQSLLPLHDIGMQRALLEMLQSGLTEDGSVSSTAQLAHLKLTCDLMERLFRNGCTADPSQKEFAGTQFCASAVRALLAYTCCEQADAGSVCGDAGPKVRLACSARQAVLTMARGGRFAWSSALAGFLAGGDSGLRQLADSATSSPREGTELNGMARFVAELLLRGLDGSVALRLSETEVSTQRRRLLNRLFQCDDAFVKVSVGLVLALLVHQDGFGEKAETANAQKGLDSLRDEVAERPNELREVDMVLILLENETWTWLCKLASSLQPNVSGFALVVIAQLVQPSPALIMGTPGFHDSLVMRLGIGMDALVRGMAARLLLSAYRGMGRIDHSSCAVACSEVELGRAVSAHVDASLAHHNLSHDSMHATNEEAQRWCDTVAALAKPLEDLQAQADSVHSKATSWRQELQLAVAEINVSEQARLEAQAALMEQRSRLDECNAKVVDLERIAGATGCNGDCASIGLLDPQAPLRMSSGEAETEQSAHEQWLDETFEARLSLTKELAARDEEARNFHLRYLAEAELDAEKAVQASGAGTDVDDGRDGDVADALSKLEVCRAEYDGMLEAVNAVRAEAAEYDDQLRVAGEFAAERSRLQEQATARLGTFKAWSHVLEERETCGTRLKAVNGHLCAAGAALGAERLQRRELRSRVRSLVASLQALDDDLEALEQCEAREHVEAPYLSSLVSG